MRNIPRIYAGIFAIAMLILVACGSQATPTPTEEAEQIEEEQKEPEEEFVEDAVEDVVEEPAVGNDVTVVDQEMGSGNAVTVASVTSDTAGWLVIHARAGGNPGPILGFAPVDTGENSDVVVNIDVAGATETLYAMLHVDAGNVGQYEFPGQDVPAVDAGGNIVAPPFQLDLSKVNAVSVIDQTLGEGNTFTIAAVRAAEPGWIVIQAQVDDNPGPILGLEPVPAGVQENIVVRIDIDDLSDVLYATLYTDVDIVEIFEFPPDDDLLAKDSEGNSVAPSFNRIPSTIEIGYNEELGAFLVGANGLTLYHFSNDEEGESTCYDQCAEAWPPVLAEEDESLSAGPDVDGDLELIRRTDGTFQVTYENRPLYFFAGDENFGDANGHTSGGVWFVIKP